MALTNEAKETITTVELIQRHRNHIARIADPSNEEWQSTSQMQLDVLTERVSELTVNLSHYGYELEYHDNTITVLKSGRKWLERTDWTEYPVEETVQ